MYLLWRHKKKILKELIVIKLSSILDIWFPQTSPSNIAVVIAAHCSTVTEIHTLKSTKRQVDKYRETVYLFYLLVWLGLYTGCTDMFIWACVFNETLRLTSLIPCDLNHFTTAATVSCVIPVWLEDIMQKPHWCVSRHRLQCLQRCFILWCKVMAVVRPEPSCPDVCDICPLGKTTQGTNRRSLLI